ncbi:hypothetical protein WR25_02170 [Diploscapter pachys]|uniref:Innexin n=1 Tax=Diploscapter pachys TaxID=2018661 RepID=A0A2A2KQL1_9BILA|nr:hypothetical protein WR25_02170 [Diploscapter pachys]
MQTSRHASYYWKRRDPLRHGRESSGYHHAAVVEVGAMVLQNMFSALSFLHYRKDDDFVDRLSYFYTSSFLIMMAVLVSFKQFGGRPLECWVPAQFTASWEAYTEMYCWAQNTYWVPIEQDIPVDISEREYRQISYYQWVPFFLLIQAFLYYIPCLMWRLMSDKSGIRMNDIVQMATEKENIEPDYRIRTIESLSRHIESALRYQHTATSRTQYTLHRVFKCFNMRYYESYVTGMYLCDFEVRVLGNTQRHSVQCVLVINIFNEKIFILIWLWFTLLFVASTLDMFYWDRFRFVLRHLELTSDPDKPELFRKEKRKQVEHFLRTYLKVDGVMVLRMIALHAGVMFCTEITDALWKRYLSQHPENLIDEDSSLITFARAQSIRRKRHDSGNNSDSPTHRQLGRIMSHRSTGGSFRLNRTQSTNRSLNTDSKGQPSPGTPQTPPSTRLGKIKPRRAVVTIAANPQTQEVDPNNVQDAIQEASQRENIPLAV